MEINAASDSFATLGHPGRLAVFRLLMRHMPQGVRPTEIAASLMVKPNTLSHHLSDLEQAGLIAVVRQGRSLFYTINLQKTGALIDYLANDCCRGRPDLCAPLAISKAVSQQPFNVLFICSGNSARSIFAEAILADIGAGRFRAFSAGTRPGSSLNPHAVAVLTHAGHDLSGLRAKHVSEFEAPDAPQMDFVFTVCDVAASEDCSPWPGQPLTAHWGVADPVKATGTEAEKALAFSKAYSELYRRIAAFAALPLQELSQISQQRGLDRIGRDDAV